jgi:integrase
MCWSASQSNPVAGIDRPRAPRGDPDIRFLDLDELEALLRAVPDDYMGLTDYALYLTAAMTGLRQGERLQEGDERIGGPVAAGLGRELGHTRSLDGRLTEALDRLELWSDPLGPLEPRCGAQAQGTNSSNSGIFWSPTSTFASHLWPFGATATTGASSSS